MTTVERREREKRQRLDLIMDAALTVFAEKGLKNATIEDVADKAELSKGTIYLYFKSKEHLFFAIDMRAGQMVSDRFQEAVTHAGTGIEQVREIGRAYYKFCFEYPNYFKTMAYVHAIDSETYKTVASEMLPGGLQGCKHKALSILSEAIDLGHRDGTISKDIHPDVMAVLLWAISNGVIGMIKNRGEILSLLGFPLDSLYPMKELLTARGLAPFHNSTETKT